MMTIVLLVAASVVFFALVMMALCFLPELFQWVNRVTGASVSEELICGVLGAGATTVYLFGVGTVLVFS